MAEDSPSQDEKTEDPTPERRDEYRERGQIAVSRDLTSVFSLLGIVILLSFTAPILLHSLSDLFKAQFESISFMRVDKDNILEYSLSIWVDVLWMIIPFFAVTCVVSMLTTFSQTRFNWSWKKMAPEWSKMNLLKGLARMVNMQALVELVKGIGKMAAVGIVAYLILRSELRIVPGLMNWHVSETWSHWAQMTQYLFWAVSSLLLVIAVGDYIYSFQHMERQMRMTKQEVKEEYKKREADPQVKARMRKIQREILARKAVDLTREATVLITNPTHYSIALKYEVGMAAPVVLAKGVDYIALKMREAAKEENITIVENRPLARDIYANVEEGDEIPDRLFKTVAEVIRYVFRLKGTKVSKK